MFRAIQGMQNHDIRLSHDLTALRFVHFFGWLRIVELAKLMKPHTSSSLEAGSRIARSLINRKLVLARRLPEGSGQALVLSTAGVRLLAEYGINATPGKNIGSAVGKYWIPSATWKHDLISHGLLCELFKQGYEVLPETEIRRRAGVVAKLPDGLVRTPSKEWLWLEVEHARKSGTHMHRLTSAIIAVSSRQIEICGVRPTRCLIAYISESFDERGYRLNHRDRITRAIAATTHSDIPIIFAECKRKGTAGISSLALTETTIEANRISAILKQLNRSGWYSDEISGVWQAHHGNFTAYVWQDSNAPGTWSYDADGNEWSGPGGYVGNISEAKRCAAALIATHQANPFFTTRQTLQE